MKFTETPLRGAFLVDLEPVQDDRGFFARSYCAAEFAAHGLAEHMPQANVSFNARRGTLRGLHFQAAPHAEDKLVRCTAGAVYDVIVDLRPGSATRGGWFGVELSALNRRALYVPKGFAHGFITLVDSSELLYLMSVPHAPGFGRGVRWNDPTIGVRWPLEPVVISANDAGLPLLDSGATGDRA